MVGGYQKFTMQYVLLALLSTMLLKFENRVRVPK
jgi:hypothetical protein